MSVSIKISQGEELLVFSFPSRNPKGSCPIAISYGNSAWTGTTALQRAWKEKHGSDQSIHSPLDGGEVESGD